jgi:anti-anti-sigma factor
VARLTGLEQGSGHIIIDLSAVDFMDTGSLAVIVGRWKQVPATRGPPAASQS